MAQPSLQADFFVAPNGHVTPRAGPLSRRLAKQVFDSSSKRCGYCGVRVRFGGRTVSPYDHFTAGHVDHILPRARGGQNEWSNLQVLCITCNTSKGAK